MNKKRIFVQPQLREAIYQERGVICESCGEVWNGKGRRFPIHHWTYAPDWYETGYYSILCWECHTLLTAWGWGKIGPSVEPPPRYSWEEYEELLNRKEKQAHAFLEKWKRT